MQGCKLQKRKPGLNRALNQLALVFVDGIPFIDGNHHRTARLQNVAGNMRILIRHALGRIDQQQNDARRFNRLQGLDHRELLDGLKYLPFATQSCGINQLKALTATLKRYRNGVPRRSRHVKGNESFFAKPRINER